MPGIPGLFESGEVELRHPLAAEIGREPGASHHAHSIAPAYAPLRVGLVTAIRLSGQRCPREEFRPPRGVWPGAFARELEAQLAPSSSAMRSSKPFTKLPLSAVP